MRRMRSVRRSRWLSAGQQDVSTWSCWSKGTLLQLRMLGAVIKAVDPELSDFIQDERRNHHGYQPC